MNKLILSIGSAFILSVACLGQDNGNTNIFAGSDIIIEGQLQNTLDVQKAKPGDRVVLKTTKAITEDGKAVVPKGAKLIGRVTEVEKKSKTNDGSRLSLLFERLESGDLTSSINATIVSVTNVAASGNVSDSANADLFGSSNASARSSSSAGGGLLGGTGTAAGGLVGGVTNAVGSTVNSGIQTVSGVAGSAGTAVNSSAGSAIRTVNGIQISNNASGSAQSGTTLAAPGRDLKLEKGASIQLQVNNEVRGQ
jgi:hypothetical protein